MRSVLVSSVLSVLAATACAAPATEDTAAGEAQEIAAKKPAAIVWVQAERKVVTRIDASGASISSALDGVEVFAGGLLHHMQTKTVTKEPLSCDDMGGTHWDNGRFQSTSLSFIDGDGGEQVLLPLLAQPNPNELLSDWQAPDVPATVGPFVFVRVAQEIMGCGAAHPGHGVDAFVYDLVRGDKVELTTHLEEATAKAAEKLAGRGFDSNEAPKLKEMLPRYDAQGNLTIAYRFERGACYACSDGLGNDYSVSAWIEPNELTSTPLPDELAPYAEAPAPVKAYLAANGSGLSGWSVSR